MFDSTPISEELQAAFDAMPDFDRHKFYQDEVLEMIREELDRHEEKQSRFGVLLAIAISLAASAIGFAVGLLF